MPLMVMEHATDPKEVVREAAGDLAAVEVFANRVLVGIYKRPDKTAGGLLLPDSVKDEDKYQGKVGLVLKMGPQAFVPDDKHTFEGADVKVGDWVVFKVSDGWPIGVNNRKGDCRILDDVDIRCRVASPDIVW